MAHTALDNAVLAAYGLPRDATESVMLGHLLGLNRERSGGAPSGQDEHLDKSV